MRYLPHVQRWEESFEFNSTVSGGHELRIFMNLPEKHMVSAFERGRIMLGIGLLEQVLFLTFSIENFCDMSDAPFSLHLLPQAEQWRPARAAPGQRAAMKFILVDAMTGIVRAIRLYWLSVPATRYLFEALSVQGGLAFSEAGYTASLAGLYGRYPSSLDIWKASPIHLRMDPRG